MIKRLISLILFSLYTLMFAMPGGAIDMSDVNNAFDRAKDMDVDLTPNRHTESMKKEAEKTFDFYQKNKKEEVEAWQKLFQFDNGKVTLKATPWKQPEERKSMLASDERIYIFISSGMPKNTLNNYAEALGRLRDSRIVMVLRGCVGGCSKILPTAKFVRGIVAPDDNTKRVVEIEIDPFLFRTYKINRVPAIVFAKGVNTESPSLSEGIASNMKSTPVSYAVHGDVSLEFAIEKINARAKNPRLNSVVTQLRKGWHDE